MNKSLITIILCSLNLFGFAQSNEADSLYHQAKAQITSKQYDEAKTNLHQAIALNQKNIDFPLLLGNIYSWQQQWDSARIWLNKAQELSPKYREIWLAQINVEKWSKQSNSALEKSNSALNLFPNDRDFLFEKALAQVALAQEKEAINTLMQLLSLYPTDSKASELLLSSCKSGMLNKLTLEYDFDFFENPYISRWHYFSLIYERRTKIGSVIAKINSADYLTTNDKLFATNTGIQYELEAYPRITKTDYLYLEYGYSPSRIFPKNRVGLELFHAFPYKFEASAGFRYLNYPNTQGNPDIWVYTGSISKYYKNYLFILRGYFAPKDNIRYSESYNFTTRRYFKNPLNYVFATVSHGISPDNQYQSSLVLTSNKLYSNMIKIGGQKMLNSRWYLSSEIGYQYQEYLQSNYRDILNFQIKIGVFF
ncbi:MAG: YaiO family outer membrane beta-barrel protein [Bacteroidota bacterium]